MTGKGDMTVVCGSCWRSCHRTSFQGAAAGHGTLSTFLDSTWLFFLFLGLDFAKLCGEIVSLAWLSLFWL